MKRRRALKQFRRVQRNLLHDRQVVEDILDEMASKWARRAEAIHAKAIHAKAKHVEVIHAKVIHAKNMAVGRTKKTN
ncbi:hypothetical protein EXS66_02575 [Candidatus Saccharibacteria bacterium]|nr:hypothetical protein [Candidatus Saccharibacteria bacterium]